MTLRNALYTMTIKPREAKRDGLVALVEDLTLRDDAPRATRHQHAWCMRDERFHECA
jgi:hypothetical protein